MRKIIVLTFLSLDGVMQAPGGPNEDTSGDFKYGGWAFPFFDETLGAEMGSQMGHPFELLLGRKTFEIFASYWPQQNNGDNEISNAKRYVVSKTLTSHEWENTHFINGDVVESLKKLKSEEGPELQVHGSSNLIQTLMKNDLVDEFWLKIFPVTLGEGKRLFAEGTLPKTFKLTQSSVTPSGVILARYEKLGPVVTGTFE